ncbi:MAG: hypothetical protein WBQ86_17320 [Candidatus Binatus sp.]
MKQAIAGALLGLAVVVPVNAGGAASAAEIADLPWNESNIDTQRSNRDDVTKFVCQVEPQQDPVPPGWGDTCGVDQFSWARSGNHQYLLVVSFLSGGSSSRDSLRIYARNSTGEISEQSEEDGIHGYGFRLEDLDGDRKDELIVSDGFGEGPSRAESPLVLWPKVYQLRNGKYVEASREFGSFYDTQVLPKLEESIATLQTKLASEAQARAAAEAVMQTYRSPLIFRAHLSDKESDAIRDSEQLVRSEMERDKILRVLGRDSTAGEKEAEKWMTNPDPWIRNASVAVFGDLADNTSELNAMTADKDGKVSSYAKTVKEIGSRSAVPSKN